MAQRDTGPAPQGNGARRQFWVNLSGAAMSLGLIAGVAVWGYQLIMRDVSGIPVVRAMQGDMRVLPDDPGGDIAVHTGLAVNELIAAGEATGPEDRLILAPSAPDLPLEDLQPPVPTPVPIAAPVDQAQTSAETLPAAAPDLAPAAAPSMNTDASADDVLAMLDEIVTEQGAAANPPPRAITRAIRPVPRPARAPSAAAAPSASGEIAVSTADFAAGTELVQLGAFSSPSVAAQEWDRLQARFGALMAGRERVIQVSNQTSGTWYRLRASGFADGDDARRFCAALQAEGAECIVVVVN